MRKTFPLMILLLLVLEISLVNSAENPNKISLEMIELELNEIDYSSGSFFVYSYDMHDNFTELGEINVSSDRGYDIEYSRLGVGEYLVDFKSSEALNETMVFNVTVRQGLKEVSEIFEVDPKEANILSSIKKNLKEFSNSVLSWAEDNTDLIVFMGIFVIIFLVIMALFLNNINKK